MGQFSSKYEPFSLLQPQRYANVSTQTFLRKSEFGPKRLAILNRAVRCSCWRDVDLVVWKMEFGGDAWSGSGNLAWDSLRSSTLYIVFPRFGHKILVSKTYRVLCFTRQQSLPSPTPKWILPFIQSSNISMSNEHHLNALGRRSPRNSDDQDRCEFTQYCWFVVVVCLAQSGQLISTFFKWRNARKARSSTLSGESLLSLRLISKNAGSYAIHSAQLEVQYKSKWLPFNNGEE